MRPGAGGDARRRRLFKRLETQLWKPATQTTEKQFQKTFAFTQQPGLSWCQCMNGASPPRLSPEVVRVSPFPFIMATTVLFRLARSYGFSNMDYLSRKGDWLWSMQDDK